MLVIPVVSIYKTIIYFSFLFLPSVNLDTFSIRITIIISAKTKPYLKIRAIILFSKQIIPYLLARLNWSSTPNKISSNGCLKKASIVILLTLLLPSSNEFVSELNNLPPSSVLPISLSMRINIIPIAIMYKRFFYCLLYIIF